MKKMFLATAGVLLAASAQAADLPSRTPAAPFIAAAPVVSWAGFYIGGQVGYGWTKTDVTVVTPGAAAFRLSPDGLRGGLHGGLHGGYNWHRGPFVYGLEGDLELANASDRLVKVVPDLPPVTLNFGSRIGLQGSLRARLGFTIDRALVYATGGVAAARLKQSAAAPGAITSVTSSEYGYTVGGGVEYALTGNLSARVEYRYTDFGKANFASLTPAVTHKSETKDQAIRVGVTYRFGGWESPILARY